jgi:hypothetical protein
MKRNVKGGFNMTYKQIEASREIRLWIGQIIIPAVTVAATMMTIPEVRQSAAEKTDKLKRNIRTKFKKQGS